jgi:hypothetical protein
VLAGIGLFGIRPKAGFKHMPLTAHKKGLIPLAEFSKVVGVPGSEVDEDEEDPPPHAKRVITEKQTAPIGKRRYLLGMDMNVNIFLTVTRI